MSASCRVCLRVAVESVGVFSTNGCVTVPAPVHAMLADVCCFQVEADDGLPDRICSRCFTKLASAYKFKQLAQLSYALLLKSPKSELHDVQIKNEFDDASPNFESELSANRFFDFSPCKVESEEVMHETITIQPTIGVKKRKKKKITSKLDTKSSSSICHLCGKQVAHLREHAKLHDTDRKRIPCGDCPRTFSTHGARNKHKTVHHQGLLYYCEICNKYYSRGYDHRRLVHSNLPKTFVCTVCDKKYHTGALLKFHMTIHTKEKPFSCSECGKGFRSRALCVYHRRRVHEGEKKHMCQFCSKLFFSPHHLVVHLRSHTKEKNYNCQECGKSFTTSSAVKIHERRHAGIKTEQCEQCNRTFINKGALKIHMISHTKEKKHECKYCGIKFGRTDHRNRHEKTAHENKK